MSANECIDLLDDDSSVDLAPAPVSQKNDSKEIEILDSSSDEDEDSNPPRKGPAVASSSKPQSPNDSPSDDDEESLSVIVGAATKRTRHEHAHDETSPATLEMDSDQDSFAATMPTKDQDSLDRKPAAKKSTVYSIDSDSDSSASSLLMKKYAPTERKHPPAVAKKNDDDSDSDSEDSLVIVGDQGPVLKKVPFSVGDSDSEDSLEELKKAKPVAKKPPPADDSDSDDSLELLLGGPTFSQQPARKCPRTVKERQKEERARQREQAKRDRQAAKEAAKEERARQREIQKLERQVAKEAEKQAKQERRQEARQGSGKFAAYEIAIVVESTWRLSPGLREPLAEAYPIVECPGLCPGAVQFIRKDHLSGGAQEAINSLKNARLNDFELLDRVVVVFDKEFLKLLERPEVDDDYPALESWLRRLQTAWRAQWNRSGDPKVVVLLPQIKDEINRLWSAHRVSRMAREPPNDAELQDAVIWMLIQYKVECIPMEFEDVLPFLLKMTRALSERPYKDQVTEIECIVKVKSHVAPDASDFAKVKDTWINQLQQFPRISFQKACSLANYYPTPQSLWQAYQNPDLSEGEKQMLVANCFDPKRTERKTSAAVYKFMTSRNRNDML